MRRTTPRFSEQQHCDSGYRPRQLTAGQRYLPRL